MNMDSIFKYAMRHLSDKRRVHTYGVASVAVCLARKYGADPEKAEIAALCHDLYRGVGKKKLNKYVEKLGLPPERYRDNANLSHGKIAAYVMEHKLEISDPDILNAVRYHTTGRAGMSQLEKVIFLADAIEPGREYPLVHELRRVAEDDLDKACMLSLQGTIRYVSQQGVYLDPDTLEALEYFQNLIKEKEDG